MEITTQEIMNEMQNMFPKELQLCMQAITIRKLEAALKENNAEETITE